MGNARGRGRFFVHSGGLTRVGGLAARTVWLAVLGRLEWLASSCRRPRMQKADAPCGTPALFSLLPALLIRAWRAA